MMVSEMISEFKRKVCSEIELEQEGVDRYIIHSPFLFDDGDHLQIYLRKGENERWELTDEGATYMELSYENMNLDTNTRNAVINRAKQRFGIEDREGEFVLTIRDEDYGNALFSFVQGILHISDVEYLKREMVRSAFVEEFKELMLSLAPRERIKFNYTDPLLDPNKDYPIDCVIEGGNKQLFIFAIANDLQCLRATISLTFYENKNVPFHSVALFENQEEINRKDLAVLTNVCEKQFSTIQAGKERLQRYAEEHLALA